MSMMAAVRSMMFFPGEFEWSRKLSLLPLARKERVQLGKRAADVWYERNRAYTYRESGGNNIVKYILDSI